MRGRIPAIKASSVIYLVIYRKKNLRHKEKEKRKKKEATIIAELLPENGQIGK